MVACRSLGEWFWFLPSDSRFFLLAIDLLASIVAAAVAGFLRIHVTSNGSDPFLSSIASASIVSVFSNRFFRTPMAPVSHFMVGFAVRQGRFGDVCSFSRFSLLLLTIGLRVIMVRSTFTRNGDGVLVNWVGPITSSSSPQVDDRRKAALFKSTDTLASDTFNSTPWVENFFLLRRSGVSGVAGTSVETLLDGQKFNRWWKLDRMQRAHHREFCTDFRWASKWCRSQWALFKSLFNAEI